MKSFASIIFASFILLSFFNSTSIKAQSEGEVSVTASVGGCGIRLRIIPEKRIPSEGNFSNDNLVIFYDQLYQELYKFDDVKTDNDGYADIDICEKGLSSTPGLFIIYVKGFSHLGKFYTDNKGFFNYTTLFDLGKTEDDYLLAGDALDHDYVNGLDINKVVSKLYSNDTKLDFNRDGIVNSLDLSNQIYNLHKSGELKI